MNSPAEIAKNYVTIGIGKMKLSVSKLLVLSIFAGMFIAFGALGSQIASVGVAPPSLAKLASAIVFPVGLMMVLSAGSELFTGNSLLVIPVLQGKASLTDMLRNWFFVYIGNFIGSLLIAAAATYSHTFSIFESKVAEVAVKTALAKVSMPLGDAFLRALLCNILVCLAVWISFAAKDQAGRIIGLFLPIYLFVICGFEHSVANMYFIPAGMMASAEYGIAADGLSIGSFLLSNLLPVTLGNIVGGACVIGFGYWFIYLRGTEPAKQTADEKQAAYENQPV